MGLRQIAFTAALVSLLTGCSHTISGAYVADGPGFVEMLQLTQSPNGAILGTLSHTQIKPNGTLDQDTFNITGAADGTSITLVAHIPIPLVPNTNMSGTVSGRGITLNLPNGSEETYTESTAEDYQSTVRHLSDQAQALRQKLQAQDARDEEAHHRADLDNQVASLNQRLSNYAAMVQSAKAQQQITDFHRAHDQLLARARRGLDIEHTHPRGSYAADQVDFAINQLQFQLNSVNFNWLNMPSTGRGHLREFDAAIAQSPCSAQPDLPHCAAQPAALHAYQAARMAVATRCDDVEATMKNDDAAMKTLVGEAEQYTHS